MPPPVPRLPAGWPPALWLAWVAIDDPALADEERVAGARVAALTDARRRRLHLAGRVAARRAVAQVEAAAAAGPRTLRFPAGERPSVDGEPGLLVSVSHAGEHAVAVAGRVRALGTDLALDRDAARLATLSPRFLPATGPAALKACPAIGAATAASGAELVARFAATEAALKALGTGVVEGGLVDGAPRVRVVSVEPPVLEPSWLRLVVVRVASGFIAVAFADG